MQRLLAAGAAGLAVALLAACATRAAPNARRSRSPPTSTSRASWATGTSSPPSRPCSSAAPTTRWTATGSTPTAASRRPSRSTTAASTARASASRSRGFVVAGSGNAVWGQQYVWPIQADYRIAYLAADYSPGRGRDARSATTSGSWRARRRCAEADLDAPDRLRRAHRATTRAGCAACRRPTRRATRSAAMSLKQVADRLPATTAVVFLALDAIWLTTMADRLYRPALGRLMLERFELAPALAFYVVYLVGVRRLRRAAGPREPALDDGARPRRAARPRRLRDLRPHQPGDAARLAVARDARRPLLGHASSPRSPRPAGCRLTAWLTGATGARPARRRDAPPPLHPDQRAEHARDAAVERDPALDRRQADALAAGSTTGW